MSFLFLLDVPTYGPAPQTPWGVLILLLVIVFVLAVAFAAGLVFLLIWLKRRKIKNSQTASWMSEK
jgi:putative copper export protein